MQWLSYIRHIMILDRRQNILVPPPSKQHYPLDADKVTCHNTVSLGGPILCRDQLEEWSASEATLFEMLLKIWQRFPRHKEKQGGGAGEQTQTGLHPSYNKANPNLVGPQNHTQELFKSALACESCKVDESTQWYAWDLLIFNSDCAITAGCLEEARRLKKRS
uniref:Uncharacterized protein n=1 Tax=Ditylenchus dipsaci TaxID=166011 RepID=A0A915D2J4_9BILA